MRVIRSDADITERIPGAVMAIGNFDGVHLGHQELLRQARERALAISGTSMALTFWPHPITLHKERNFLPIQPLEERLESMASYGVDYAAVMAFDSELADHTPEEFVVGKLLKNFDLKTVIIGFNHNFGKDRSGDANTMRDLGRKYGFEVVALDAVDFKGQPVSSSRVRRALAAGCAEGVRELLGRPYSLKGKVVMGHRRGGRLLGFPTANLETEPRQIPLEGIYAVWVHRGDKRHMGALSIGTDPTFGVNPRTLEVFILDFDADIYGEELRLEFAKRLRDERKYDDIDALKAQIARDVEEVRRVLR